MTVNAGSPLTLSLIPHPYVHSPRFLMVLKSASIGIINASVAADDHASEGKRETDTHYTGWN